MPAIILKPGREKSVIHKHPWIFSGSVAEVRGSPESGETVDVLSSSGQFLGRAAFGPESQIRARMWSWDEEKKIDEGFFRQKLQKAIEMRRAFVRSEETDAMRLVHAESDWLPGLIVDQYADQLVVQILTAGMEYWSEIIINLLVEMTGINHVYERSDVDVRTLEGLKERVGVLKGSLPSEKLMIHENGLKFWVNVIGGQKTGFYLDQRENREKVRKLVNGRSVLNCFCYTGAFSIYALSGGASEILSIDSSTAALDWGKEQVLLNTYPTECATWKEGDVFHILRELRDRGKSFDAVILDPPKFAPTAAQVDKAARGYKDINLLAFKLLRPGGLLFTFSCSGGVSAELFTKIVSGASLDAGVDARIIEKLQQGSDHPVRLGFPEGDYLKGLICQVV